MKQVSFKSDQVDEVAFGGQIPKSIDRTFLTTFISQQIDYLNSKSSFLELTKLKSAIDLVDRFEYLQQVYEPFWNHSSHCQDYYYHFLIPHESTISPVTAFTVKRQYEGIANTHKTMWEGCLLKWDAVFAGHEKFEIITLPKAKLLKPEELSVKIKWDAISSIKDGQPIFGNRLYFTNAIETYCLPLVEIIGCSPQHLSIIFDKTHLKFEYSYHVERKTAGSGWYETKVYKGYIDIKTWEKEETLIDVSQDKWD